MDIFNLMQKHKNDPLGQHDHDDRHEGHVLVMEKSAIGKGIGNRLGTKWVHRHLHVDLNKRKLIITHPDETEKHKMITYYIAPGNALLSSIRFLLEPN